MAWGLLLAGMPNSGKSTIAYHLVQKRIRNALIIDGDKHREMQFLGRKLGFTKYDIMLNTEHVIKLAKFAQEQGINVIIAQITPYKEQRDLMRKKIDKFADVFCCCSLIGRTERPNFRGSDLPFDGAGFDLAVDTEYRTVDECCNEILQLDIFK